MTEDRNAATGTTENGDAPVTPDDEGDEPNYLLWAVVVSVVGIALLGLLLFAGLFLVGFGL